MIISVTERGTFRRCHLQWHYTAKNGLHLEPIVVAPYLSLGTLMHKGGESWLLNPDRPYEFHVRAAAVEMEQSKRDRYRAITHTNISEAEMTPFYESIDKAVAMAHNYQVRWGAPIPDDFVCVQPEQKIQIPIPGTEHTCTNCTGGMEVVPNTPENVSALADYIITDHEDDLVLQCRECNGTKTSMHVLEGRLDGLLQMKSDGSIWVLERKTYGNRPKPESLVFNDQFLAYLWMLTKLEVANVGGIAYDGLWSREKPPRGSTMEDLFLRRLLTRSMKEIEMFGYHLAAEANQMYAIQAGGIYVPNRAWTGCWDCKVSKICDAYMRGEDTNRIIRAGFIERTDDVEEGATEE